MSGSFGEQMWVNRRSKTQPCQASGAPALETSRVRPEDEGMSERGDLPHVVIVGGGFGGLYAAWGLAGRPVGVTLLDRRNHHLFQPLLYQVATATLNPSDIAVPIRSVLRRQKNVRVLLGEATRVDTGRHLVHLADGAEEPYDYLVLATGATHSYFGKDVWAAVAPGLKSLEDALEIRRRVSRSSEGTPRYCARGAGEGE